MGACRRPGWGLLQHPHTASLLVCSHWPAKLHAFHVLLASYVPFSVKCVSSLVCIFRRLSLLLSC